jgi:ceramide glucosyltransferase
MTLLILCTGSVCAIAILVHLASILVVIIRVRRADEHALKDDIGGISILRPVCGLENFAEETLASTFRLDHPRYEIVFCVAHAGDDVVPLVRRLIAAYPDVPARLLIGNEPISINPKLNNIVKGWAAAKYPWIVMADSNVLMPRDYLPRLLQIWRTDTGLVSSPAVGCAPANFWAQIECDFLNTYQVRWQCFADGIGLGFAQGKNMLWCRNILENGGGISALASEVAEDAAATKLVRSQGLRVRVIHRPFEQPLGYRSASEVWGRQVRWARMRRDTFTPYFIIEFMAGSVPPLAACAICALAAELPVTPLLAAVAFIWYGTEVLLAHMAGWHLSWRSPLSLIIRDLLLPVLWITSWQDDEFVWRGNKMRLAGHGLPA